MKKSNKKTPIIFHVGIVVLCLFLVTTYMTGGLYARYSSSASGEDGARVARFEIDTSLKTDNAVIDLSGLKPGETKTIALSVENKSEVSVEYFFTVETLKNLPLEITFSGGGSGNLLVNGTKTAEHTLTVTWPEEKNDVAYAYELDVVIVLLECHQID